MTDRLYMIPGAGGNTAVFLTASGVVIVDTKLANNGQAILDQVKAVSDKPITHIINTHTHGDHTGSNMFFPASVEIVTHENTIEVTIPPITTTASGFWMSAPDPVA